VRLCGDIVRGVCGRKCACAVTLCVECVEGCALVCPLCVECLALPMSAWLRLPAVLALCVECVALCVECAPAAV
jgi:hypothetical protein